MARSAYPLSFLKGGSLWWRPSSFSGGGGVYNIRKEMREIAEPQDVAAALGLKVYRTLEVDPTLGDHPLLKRGLFPTVNHAMVGRYNDVDTLMFDFGYEDISDDTPDHYLRTAVVFTDQDMKAPEFELRSAGLRHRIFGSLFGGHEREESSSRHVR